jgi:hypothetical protein
MEQSNNNANANDDWKITIEKVNNGFLLQYMESHTHHGDVEKNVLQKVVFEEKENSEHENMKDVLKFIREFFGYYNGKHEDIIIDINVKTRKKNEI